MIIVMKPGAKENSIRQVLNVIENNQLEAHLSNGKEVTIIGVVGDKTRLRDKNLELFEDVEKIVEVTESYKLANKKFHPLPSIINLRNTTIGGDEFVIMSGPCAVESEEQVMETAKAIKASGAQILRGGAYKPRTSPYSFQGLEEDGLKLMKEAREETGLSIVCEVTSLEAIETAAKYVDMLQIGARNMQNFYLLKE
ncbi:MAG: 3-deoxy-7-phosphoheptulonate synthase, partial [Acetivibrio sp.]